MDTIFFLNILFHSGIDSVRDVSVANLPALIKTAKENDCQAELLEWLRTQPIERSVHDEIVLSSWIN